MFTKVLIANRGAIATRIERTLRKMGVKSVAIYATADRDSLHVSEADEAVSLGDGTVKETYLDAEKILKIAKETHAEAIHPGYGFLSENTDFAKACEDAGIRFIGPTAEEIQRFGLKHSARALAESANVPLLPGTGLLNDLDEAVKEAKRIGYPVMLKSTAGGGGIGIRICESEEDLRRDYDAVKHLAAVNFKDSGVFLEKYIRRARHVEVQIFGNAEGEAVAIGERDCSVQRRSQKVVEESPAPNLSDDVRQKMYQAAVDLAHAASYRNAGTVEFLYDEASESFYFLEVNTRLQVEHGITEEVMGIDLVEWMVREAAGELRGLASKVGKPNGHAIEIRVYAEDCSNDFRPSSGRLDDCHFDPKARVETWVKPHITVSPLYDPMLAKIIVHEPSREAAVKEMQRVIKATKLYGVTTNLEYLSSLFQEKSYREGKLFTKMLDAFHPEEHALDVLDGGIQSTVQDARGMLGFWTVGVPPCGAMDAYSFRIGNRLLGNDENAAGIEMTLRGGSYRFRTTTTFCLTGAEMHATLDGENVPLYQAMNASPGSVLKLGTAKQGMRTYLLVAGGLDIPKVMDSTSTFIDGKFGGHNGRALRTGDVLELTDKCLTCSIDSFPEEYAPKITNHWTLGVLPGPQPTEEYLASSYLTTLTSAEYTVNFDSARTGVRLNGPVPEWTREDGGEAGLHPSNIHDNAYAIGTLDLTGDQSILLGPDGPSLGGFVCPVTLAKAELWKIGQLHPGDKVHFQLLNETQAAELREAQEKNIAFEYTAVTLPAPVKVVAIDAILAQGTADGFPYDIRRDGEENILVEIGKMELDIALRFRVHILMETLETKDLPIIDMTPGIRSLQVHFDCSRITARKMAENVEKLLLSLGDLDDIEVPSRVVYLPLSWDDPQTQLAAKRYQETTRPDAPWCPSNPEFIRRINGLKSIDDVRDIVFKADYLVLGLGDVYLGAPVATPVDPRQRLVTTKYNPARPWTPENAVGIGGAYLCVYGMEGPGGYQFVGRTIQMWNPLQTTKYFSKDKPWLLNFFDQIRFFPCSADEILKYREDFLRGKYDIRVEETTFSLGKYKEYLASIEESAKAFKAHQEAAFEAERQRWHELGLDTFVSDVPEPVQTDVELKDSENGIPANVPGSVWKVEVKAGQKITKGDTLFVLESMKMEIPITASGDGVISRVFVDPGSPVNAGDFLAAYEAG